MIVQSLADSASDTGGAAVGGVIIIVISVISFIFYWIPTVVAFIRGVDNKVSVLVINLFLGWTLIGWVVALAMAVRSHPKPIQYAPPYPPPYPTQ